MKAIQAAISAVLIMAPTAALCQGAAVQVALGPAVQARVHDLGPDALDQERRDLAAEVSKALARLRATQGGPGGQGGGIVGAELVIEDIQPTRPTPAQLGRSAGLSPAPRGLGGAAITGFAVQADGSRRPIRFRYFPSTLANDLNTDTWGDAEQAFDELAGDLAKGQTPYDNRSWPPPHKAETLTGTRIPD